MKPLIQKLPLNESSSFVAKTFRTPNFEVGWHQHIEYELILFTEGSGLSFVGNHVGEFETGDIYFLGANLPHTFQKRDAELTTSAVVIQFKEDFWGSGFLDIPECKNIQNLLKISESGLKITGETREKLCMFIKNLETADSFSRIIMLCQCLELISTSKEFIKVSTQDINQQNNQDSKINKVFQFTIDNFKESISLSQIASITHMSIPAFCNYFKRSTKKTYIDFLNEIRIGYACHLLMETEKSVLDICYQSGFNTMANFHKQFQKIKKQTPLKYRKGFNNLN